MGTAQLAFVELVRCGATGSHVTGSHVTGSDVTGSPKYVLRMPGFPRAFFLSRVVVQVPRLPKVSKGHMTPSVFPWVCACTTASCTIFTLAGPFDRK